MKAAATRKQGIALVIVLAFIVLITGAVVAYFSRAMAGLRLSESNLNQSRAEQLAVSAADIVTGDLIHEIKAGSINPPPDVSLYEPAAPVNMVPVRNVGPNTSGVDPFPNLIRVSRVNDPIPLPGVPSRASAVNTEGAVSANGRWIRRERWNRSLLLPRANPGAGSRDNSPLVDFTAPDWVFVSETGPQVISTPGRGIVGRYAFAIYDTGGLLDINVAGYPANSPPEHYARKQNSAYADLTKLPAGLTSAQIDALAGWRNYATIQPGGSFPALTLMLPAHASRFFEMVTANRDGFLRVSGNRWNNQSDQVFHSRQSLLAYTQAAQINPDVVQFLTTFSRSLEQPGSIPDPNRPKVRAADQGGNNAAGLDDLINPNFFMVRVKNTFTRGDGSLALPGEPLVKKRFALQRLAWLTCRGPSASRASSSDPDIQRLKTMGISQDWLQLGTAPNIETYFGLSWDTANLRWKYNLHNREGTTGPIRKLDSPSDTADVARAGREPDFFELLKAGINVGSIGKTISAPSSNLDPVDLQYRRDYSVDNAIIQIGANMIDQSDVDGFPTRIIFNDGGGSDLEFRGVENLPYIYRARSSVIQVAAPKLADGTSPYGWGFGDGKAITDTGVGALVKFPDVWNPHDWDSSNLDQTMGVIGPTRFRIYAATDTQNSSLIASALSATQPYAVSNFADTAKSVGSYRTWFGHFAGEQRGMTQTNTEMTFQIDRSSSGASLFREPVILFQPGKPTGSNLASVPMSSNRASLGKIGAGPFFTSNGLKSDVSGTDGTNLPKKGDGYVGFYLGSVPLQWINNGAGSQRYPGLMIWANQAIQITYYLQCQDAAGNWITYDEKRGGFVGANGMMLTPEASFLHQQGLYGHRSHAIDPRSSRFSFIDSHTSAGYDRFSYPPFKASVAANSMKSGWINQAEGIVCSDRSGTSFGIGLTVDAAKYATASMGWFPGGWNGSDSPTQFRPGAYSQNNPNVSGVDQNISDQTGSGDGFPTGSDVVQYYSDPDGVVRRASSGYSDLATRSVSGNASVAANVPGFPMATANRDGSSRSAQSESRPVVLNRPFRSVADLGYVFSGTPWKNLSFHTPESGDSALLDVFCIQDTTDPKALVAGKINLNTRQIPVLEAIVAGACRDELKLDSISGGGAGTLANRIAAALVNRTTSSDAAQGPLRNISELTGKWTRLVNVTGNNAAVDGSKSYSGFSQDLGSILSGPADQNIQRMREASIRALAASGQTRVWNLMIDLIAQAGRFTPGTTSLERFLVEGEQRFWVHLAIDRYTGEIIDKQVEVVTE